jgi:hypothetical protein
MSWRQCRCIWEQEIDASNERVSLSPPPRTSVARTSMMRPEVIVLTGVLFLVCAVLKGQKVKIDSDSPSEMHTAPIGSTDARTGKTQDRVPTR